MIANATRKIDRLAQTFDKAAGFFATRSRQLPLLTAAGQSMASGAFSMWRLVSAGRWFSMARFSIWPTVSF